MGNASIRRGGRIAPSLGRAVSRAASKHTQGLERTGRATLRSRTALPRVVLRCGGVAVWPHPSNRLIPKQILDDADATLRAKQAAYESALQNAKKLSADIDASNAMLFPSKTSSSFPPI